MTRERIKDFKEIILPFFTIYFLKENYEGLGKSDAEEFEKDFNEILNLAAKALEQESCEDVISRDDALKALDYDIKFEFKSGVGKHMNETANLLNTIYKIQSDNIKALPPVQSKPIECEDAISMMDLLNNLHKHFSKGFETDEWWNSTHVLQAVKDCRPELFDLNYVSSVQPKPKTGQWVLLDECSNSGYYCSECHKKLVKEGWSGTVKKIKFCPNCGCRMVEPQESEDKE